MGGHTPRIFHNFFFNKTTYSLKNSFIKELISFNEWINSDNFNSPFCWCLLKMNSISTKVENMRNIYLKKKPTQIAVLCCNYQNAVRKSIHLKLRTCLLKIVTIIRNWSFQESYSWQNSDMQFLCLFKRHIWRHITRCLHSN